MHSKYTTAPMYEKTNEQENINNYQQYAYWLLKEDSIPTCIWCKAFQESKRGVSNCEAVCTLCILSNNDPFWNWINIICILPFLNYLCLSCTGLAKATSGRGTSRHVDNHQQNMKCLPRRHTCPAALGSDPAAFAIVIIRVRINSLKNNK